MHAVRQSLRWSQNPREARPKSDLMLMNGALVHVVPIPKYQRMIPEMYRKYEGAPIEQAEARPGTETAAQAPVSSSLLTTSKQQIGRTQQVEDHLNM